MRKQLGIALEGEGGIRTLRQALFHCPELYDRIRMGKGRHYHVADAPLFPFIILQDSTRHWTLHAAPPTDADMPAVFAQAMGMPLEFETLSVNEWTQHLLCATSYGDGRVFIAGDAAHLVIPTGGLGMNTGRRRRGGPGVEAGGPTGGLGRAETARVVHRRATPDWSARPACLGRGDGRPVVLACRTA